MGGKKKKKKVKKKAVTPVSNVASNRSSHTDAYHDPDQQIRSMEVRVRNRNFNVQTSAQLPSYNQQQELKSEINKFQLVDPNNHEHGPGAFGFMQSALISPSQQTYVQIADSAEEMNLQSYVDGYDIVAPGPIFPMGDHQSNIMLTNSGEYNHSSTHNEGGSMNVLMSAGGGGHGPPPQGRQGGKQRGNMVQRS